MVNSAYLSDIIKGRGIKKEALSFKLGISPTSLRNKMSGVTDFRANEIEKISIALMLSKEEVIKIFFSELEACNG